MSHLMGDLIKVLINETYFRMLRTIWMPDQTAGSASWNVRSPDRKVALILATSSAIQILVFFASKNLWS